MWNLTCETFSRELWVWVDTLIFWFSSVGFAVCPWAGNQPQPRVGGQHPIPVNIKLLIHARVSTRQVEFEQDNVYVYAPVHPLCVDIVRLSGCDQLSSDQSRNTPAGIADHWHFHTNHHSLNNLYGFPQISSGNDLDTEGRLLVSCPSRSPQKIRTNFWNRRFLI